MNKPPVLNYIFGSIAARAVMYPLSAIAGWDLFTGQADTGVDVAILLTAAGCTHAARQVSAFRAYQREWDATAGVPPKLSLLQRFRPSRGVVAFALGTLLTGFLLCVLPPDAATLVTNFYLLVCAAWVGRMIYRWRKGLRAQDVDKSGSEPATVCLAVPTTSPTLKHSVAAMPAYARELVERSAIMEATRHDHPV